MEEIMVQVAFPETSQRTWKKGVMIFLIVFVAVGGGLWWLMASTGQTPLIFHKKEACIEQPSLSILQELEDAAKNKMDKLFIQKTIQQVHALNGNIAKVDRFAEPIDSGDPLLKAFVQTSYQIIHKQYDKAFSDAKALNEKLSSQKENILYGMNLFRLVVLSGVHAPETQKKYCQEFSIFCHSSTESAQRLKQCLTFKGFDVESFISLKMNK